MRDETPRSTWSCGWNVFAFRLVSESRFVRVKCVHRPRKVLIVLVLLKSLRRARPSFSTKLQIPRAAGSATTENR